MSTLAFLIFGALLARSLTPEPEAMVVMGVGAALTGGMATRVLRALLLSALNPTDRLRLQSDRFLDQAFALLLPFALLAVLAQIALAWEAALAFLISGLGASATTAASCAARHGAPTLRSSAIAILWVMPMSLLATTVSTFEWFGG